MGSRGKKGRNAIDWECLSPYEKGLFLSLRDDGSRRSKKPSEILPYALGAAMKAGYREIRMPDGGTFKATAAEIGAAKLAEAFAEDPTAKDLKDLQSVLGGDRIELGAGGELAKALAAISVPIKGDGEA